MRFGNVPAPEGYEVIAEIAGREDKTIYLVTGKDGGLYVLKVFKRIYKYPVYENLSTLTHINMPKIHETFLMEDCFYVLEEYAEGRTLQEILETDGAFDAKTAVDIILQLCDVLMYLHNRIIHRDITPANIILTNDGVVKLLDFDIAREHKKEAEKDTEILGTKPFAPPEQYGFAQSDHRTDIYSLGILLTVMLTNTFDPKRIKSLRLMAVVKRCTALDPRKRYEDARQLKNRIKLCMSPDMLLYSLTNMDTNIYVFPNSRLRVAKMAVPIIVLYFMILALAFVQPCPPDGYIPGTSLFLFTIVINPKWTASDAQYKIFYVAVYALLFTLIAFISFAVYDILRFNYLKAIQKHYLKRNAAKKPGAVPFIIASKRYMHCTLAIISTMAIGCSIPFTDVWADYDIHGFVILTVLICNTVSFPLRGARHPKYYNKAVRCYYGGDLKKASEFARKSAGIKKNHAGAWLAEIQAAEEDKLF